MILSKIYLKTIPNKKRRDKMEKIEESLMIEIKKFDRENRLLLKAKNRKVIKVVMTTYFEFHEDDIKDRIIKINGEGDPEEISYDLCKEYMEAEGWNFLSDICDEVSKGQSDIYSTFELKLEESVAK